MRQYQQVTDRIVAMLEAGTRPWAQGWNAYAGGGRPLRHEGTPYRGANVLNLWAAGLARGFSSPYWLTYIAGWLKALKHDNRNIFRAASYAEKAADLLHSFQAQQQMAA